MNFLAPITAIIAAAVTVPLLVLLYFLKLKRTETLVSSTLLWKRAVRDLQVNAPFQRLRRNILLLLQLLALAAILLALSRPVLSLTAGPAKRYVVLIDRSASMNATDVGPSRLDEAKRQAKIVVESLRSRSVFSLTDEADQAMVIAFADQPKVMCNFTSEKRQLMAAIDAIEATDGGSALADAVTVGRAFAQPVEQEGANMAVTSLAQLELYSDGRIEDLDDIAINPKDLKFHCIGKSPDNVAITTMQARRSYEKAEQVNIFATVCNFSAQPVNCDVQLSIDGDVRAVKTVSISAAAKGDGEQDDVPGRASISFALAHGGAGLVEVRHLHKDQFSRDDAVWQMLEPPKQLSVLLVTEGNMALSSALKACPLARFDTRRPGKSAVKGSSAIPTDGSYDVVVLDRHVPDDLPRGRYIVFGASPKGLGVSAGREVKNQLVVDWRAQHPVLQYVNLTNLFASNCLELKLPGDAEVLAEFLECPAIALVRRRGSVFLLLPFDVMESNWPFEPGFVAFFYNATAYLGMEVGDNGAGGLRVGQTITVEGLQAGASAELTRPDGNKDRLRADSAGTLRCPSTERAGIYSLEIENRPAELFAVNILNEEESNLAPAPEIVVSGKAVKAKAGAAGRSNVDIWPWLAVLALIVVCVEWFVYNSRVRL